MTTLRDGDNIPGASTLTAEERTVVRTGLEALDHLEKSIYRLMEVGDAVLMLKAKAESIVGYNERTLPNLLRVHGFEQLTGRNRALLTRLLQIMDKRGEVLAWHARLPLRNKLAWLSPSSIVRHCPALVDAETAARRTTSGQARRPNVVRDAAELHRLLQQANARISELEEERDGAVPVASAAPERARDGARSQPTARINSAARSQDLKAAKRQLIQKLNPMLEALKVEGERDPFEISPTAILRLYGLLRNAIRDWGEDD